MIFFCKGHPLFCVCMCSLVGLTIYLYGFFPVNPRKIYWPNERNREVVSPLQPFKRHIDKLVLIIIDSLRYDFLLPNNENPYMSFTASSAKKGDSCLLAVRADSPTVTMPRIKAITSGTSSTYVDVILNFMSSDIGEDNFVTKASSHGLNIVFYGDETWLKLFPKEFLRSEGTNSFFALDFTEVDNNVTRHISSELEKTDWHVMILHYLGLDHIGHLEGPKSSHTEPKLREMDNIVKNISSTLKSLEKRFGLKTMIIVTSDHGMKDSGGHGGVTHPEIMVPLVSVGNPCKKLEGWPENSETLQIDIAPTVSALLGLPPPISSMGKLIPHLLNGMEDDDIMKYLEINRLQLQKFQPFQAPDSELHPIDMNLAVFLSSKLKNENTRKTMILNYFLYLNQMSQNLRKTCLNFKLIYIIIGLLFLWTSVGFLLYQISPLLLEAKLPSKRFLIVGVLLHSISFTSSSFIEEEHQTWYFLWTTFSLLVTVESIAFKGNKFLQKFKISLPWILICCVHRILRKLNQTGDKWAFLPDIKSFLNSPEGQPWLNLQFFAGIFMIFSLALRGNCSKGQLVSYGLSLLSVVCFRINTGNIKISLMKHFLTSRQSSEVAIFWIVFIIFSVQSFRNKTPAYLNWLLFGALLLRPHNVVLLPIQVLTSKLINSLFRGNQLTTKYFWTTAVHVWLGNVFYFYQGNSNSLASIDVAPGFIGVQTYNPFYAGIMTIVHTFSSQILSFLLSPESSTIHITLRITPLSIYCTFLLFQLNHLFIWSVFSPKLLYETVMTLLIMILVAIKNCICQISLSKFAAS